MNIRMIIRYLGYLLIAEGFFLFPSVIVSIIYRETHILMPLTAAIAACMITGAAFCFFSKKPGTALRIRESFAIVGIGWMLVSLFGALPFWLSGEIPRFIDAYFESVSGFTTTGASILADVEAMSRGLLFWRSFTHWLGGMGILVFLLALVRAKRGAGFTLHLLKAESPGPQVKKLLPKTRDSVRLIYLLYIALSLVNLIFLLLGGMPLFEALCAMFGTAGTGGVGFKNDSLASYSSYIQAVTAVFMTLFGVNFSIYFLLLCKEWKAALKDEELRAYLGIMLAVIPLCFVSLLSSGSMNLKNALYHSAFTVSSMMTTTGYVTVDFTQWPEFTKSLLLIMMIFGAMAGSTGGGIKISRILIVIKSAKTQIYKLLHPRSVKMVTMNGKPLDSSVINRTFLYFSVYAIVAVVSFLLVSFDNLPFETNLSAVISCLNNIGPGLGLVGPSSNYSALSTLSKLVLSLDMLLGRLELLPILVLLSPSAWKP